MHSKCQDSKEVYFERMCPRHHQEFQPRAKAQLKWKASFESSVNLRDFQDPTSSNIQRRCEPTSCSMSQQPSALWGQQQPFLTTGYGYVAWFLLSRVVTFWWKVVVLIHSRRVTFDLIDRRIDPDPIFLHQISSHRAQCGCFTTKTLWKSSQHP